MSKITLSNIASLTDEQTAIANINANSLTIKTAGDNFLSRDGTSPNQMLANLDMNSHRILNLSAPVSVTDPIRVQDLSTLLAPGATINTTDASNILTGTLALARGGLGGDQSAATANEIPVYPGSSGAAVPSTLSTWFDAVLSSTIGQFAVRASSGWVASGLGYANPVWWGADPTGVADSSAAFASAIAASSNIYFPAGKFKFNSQLTVSVASKGNVHIRGAGVGQTTLYWPATGGGIAITLADDLASFHLEDLTGTVGVVNGGTFLTVTQTANSATPANAAPSFVNGVTIRGDDGYALTDYWTCGISLNKVNNVSFNLVSFYGNSGGTAGEGIHLDGTSSSVAVVFNLSNCYFYALSTGLRYGVTNGYVQGVTVTNSNFTGCQYGILSPTIGGTGMSGLSELSVNNCQFACTLMGIGTYCAIDFLAVSNCLFLNSLNGSFGIALTHGQSFQIGTSAFQGVGFTTVTGIYVGTSHQSETAVIAGNTFDHFGAASAAINLDTGSANIIVGQNGYSNCSLTIHDIGTGNSIPTGTGGVSLTDSPVFTTQITVPKLLSGSSQVVGARVTGYTAMTGTPDKATAYATSTVTLAQLAGRVMQLQADLTAHGLIGA